MPRIALSPSTQTWNVGHYSGTNEQDVNYEIASLLAPILRAAGVECDIMTAGRGNPGSGYVANADQSNRQGPYLAHVCLHTDAGGATGTTAFYYPGSVSGENLARAIYDQLAPLSPGADHGVRARADLYELSATTAISVLVETAPHDRAADAAWIQNSIPEIAQAYARGILGWLAAGGYITYTQEDDMPKLTDTVTLANGETTYAEAIRLNDANQQRLISDLVETKKTVQTLLAREAEWAPANFAAILQRLDQLEAKIDGGAK